MYSVCSCVVIAETLIPGTTIISLSQAEVPTDLKLCHLHIIIELLKHLLQFYVQLDNGQGGDKTAKF